MLEAVNDEDGRTTRPASGSRPSSKGPTPGPAGGHRVKAGALLGIGDREDVAVVGGVIIRLERTGSRQAGQKGEPTSASKTVQATLELHLAALRQWALTPPVELAVYVAGSLRTAAGGWLESTRCAVRARQGDSAAAGSGRGRDRRRGRERGWGAGR
jgi:hypothetical protein